MTARILNSRQLEVQRNEYSGGQRRPLKGYGTLLGAYGAIVAGLALVVRASRRELPRPTVGDVALLAVATHKASRLLTKDAVTSPLRAPSTRYDKPAGEGEVCEQVHDGAGQVRHAVGELVSCPFCLSVWTATTLTAGLVLAPGLTRLVATALSAVAGADFLQLAYGIARRAAQDDPQASPPQVPDMADAPRVYESAGLP
ncbi:DUF1360 domain-containing protein [Catellatospora sichuanensis]|uniref:DUF1360 domain-containing protein n=1 Tax=Catellatospora sichuanensis TaxID=1969805 RepID=UPI001FE28BD8|nr:DUF1360 domain-containing protein [Catellatospora sichuanensis]